MDLSVNSFAPISNLLPIYRRTPALQHTSQPALVEDAAGDGSGARRSAAWLRIYWSAGPSNIMAKIGREKIETDIASSAEHWGCRLQGQPANKALGPPATTPFAPVLPIAMR